MSSVKEIEMNSEPVGTRSKFLPTDLFGITLLRPASYTSQPDQMLKSKVIFTLSPSASNQSGMSRSNVKLSSPAVARISGGRSVKKIGAVFSVTTPSSGRMRTKKRKLEEVPRDGPLSILPVTWMRY